MEYRRLGESELEISALTLGCWAFGGGAWGDVDDAESIAAVHAAIDLGINIADTAEVYGGGRSEEVLGKALLGRRDKMMIATKVWSSNLAPQDIREALEASLTRLQTDYVDLYQIHWPNDDIPIADSMGVLSDLRSEGKIRVIGVSNFNSEQMIDALKIARFESLQPPYNLFWRMVESDQSPFCEENNISVIPYCPMAQGLLTGKFSLDNPPDEGDVRLGNRMFKSPTWEEACKAVEAYRPIADSYGKTMAQLSLNWLMHQQAVTSPIVGAKRPSPLEDTVGAVGWSVSDDDIEKIRKISDPVNQTLGDDQHMWH